jgi:hypothetical protein
MSSDIYSIEQFNLGTAANSGGKTGSVQAPGPGGRLFQLKPSILDAGIVRRLVSQDLDRSNVGEVIACCIGRHLLSEHQVPEVSFVYDPRNPRKKRIWVASQYLGDPAQGDKVQTLDDFARAQGVEGPETEPHVRFVGQNPGPGEYALYDSPDTPAKQTLRQGIAQALVVSICLGDYDINPGNMMAITNKRRPGDPPQIARIDFGHSFLNLIRTFRVFGGQSRHHNRVIDFFNRRNIGGKAVKFDFSNFRFIKIGDLSKLWRDYAGMLPSVELVEALRGFAQDSGQIERGIEDAALALTQLLSKLEAEGDQQNIQHLKKTLAALYNTISTPEISKAMLERMPPEVLISRTLDGIRRFSIQNQKNMAEVADVMDLQFKIDALLKTEFPPYSAGAQKQIEDLYQQLVQKYSPDPLAHPQKIQWLKTTPNSRAVYGTLAEYVYTRTQQLTERGQMASQSYTTLDGQKYKKSPFGSGKKERVLLKPIDPPLDKQWILTEAALEASLAATTIHRFPRALLPASLRGAVCFPRLILGKERTRTEKASRTYMLTPHIVSTTAENQVTRLDKLLYPPKGIRSFFFSFFKSTHQKAFDQFLQRASDDVKWQFAAGLYVGAATGEQKLDFRQYFAETNPTGQIVRITKIHPPPSFHRQQQIALSTAVEHPDIQSKYNALCQHKPDGYGGVPRINEIRKQAREETLSTLAALSGDQKTAAIQGLLKIINQGKKQKDKLKTTDPKILADRIGDLAAERVPSMHHTAKGAACDLADLAYLAPPPAEAEGQSPGGPIVSFRRSDRAPQLPAAVAQSAPEKGPAVDPDTPAQIPVQTPRLD